eukprot:g13090.t1
MAAIEILKTDWEGNGLSKYTEPVKITLTFEVMEPLAEYLDLRLTFLPSSGERADDEEEDVENAPDAGDDDENEDDEEGQGGQGGSNAGAAGAASSSSSSSKANPGGGGGGKKLGAKGSAKQKSMAQLVKQFTNGEYDQVLDELEPGKRRVTLEGDPPNMEVIPSEARLDIAGVVITAEYKGKEFFRIGWYLSHEHEDEDMNKDDGKHVLAGERIDWEKIVRRVDVSHPILKKTDIEWEKFVIKPAEDSNNGAPDAKRQKLGGDQKAAKLPDGTRVSSNRPTKNFKEKREQASLAAAPPPNANVNLTRDAKKLFSYGNFDTHYSCRSDRFQTIDARLLILLKYLQLGDTKHYTGDVFFGKRVLDVGCGIGCNAFALAGFLNASYVLGVDVDLKCVQTALKQLRKVKQDGVAFYEGGGGDGEQRPPKPPTIAGVRMARPAEVEKSVRAGGVGEEQEEAAGGLKLNQALLEEVGGDLRRTSVFPKCLVQTRSVIPYVQKPYLLSEEPPLVRKKSDFDFPYNIEFRTEDVCAPDSRGSTLMGFADLVHDYNLISGKGNAGGDFHSGSAAAARSSRTPKSRGGTAGAVSELQQQALLREQVDPRFDTILLFSLVKFVHTNHGDAGLEMLFDRCYELLKPGGVLAVEENEKVKVKKKKHQTEVMRSVILPELKHRPEDFKQLLCGRDGERFVNVQVVHKDQFPDLTRSLYLFTKKK